MDSYMYPVDFMMGEFYNPNDHVNGYIMRAKKLFVKTLLFDNSAYDGENFIPEIIKKQGFKYQSKLGKKFFLWLGTDFLFDTVARSPNV
jgi:hypothetical protein